MTNRPQLVPMGLTIRSIVRPLCGITILATPLAAQPIDTLAIRAAFRAFERTCALPAARAWSATLCGPMIFVDRGTRAAFTNAPDPDRAFVKHDGYYTGTATNAVPFANTSFGWGTQRWATVMLPLPRTEHARIALLAHEATHRVHDSLQWNGRDLPNTHLDTELGRVWWRVELRAWQHALTTAGQARRAHVRAAFAFRRERARLFPGSDSTEDALEYAEGTAEYLGQRVALAQSTMGILAVIDAMRGVDANPSLVRSAGYATGPALGLLLDAYAPTWHAQLRTTHSMATLLASATQSAPQPLTPDALRALALPYGYARIASEESERATTQRETRERLVAALVTGPTLSLRQSNLGRSFDPNTLVPLDSLGMAYPVGEFTAEWGTLTLTDGPALVARDETTLRVAARTGGTPLALGATGTIRTAQWTLVLKPGWSVRAGTRDGDFVIGRTP